MAVAKHRKAREHDPLAGDEIGAVSSSIEYISKPPSFVRKLIAVQARSITALTVEFDS
jgi:hypothetical protein